MTNKELLDKLFDKVLEKSKACFGEDYNKADLDKRQILIAHAEAYAIVLEMILNERKGL